MVAIAIFSADPALRRRLERLSREDSSLAVIGIVESPSALLQLATEQHLDVILAQAPPSDELADWQRRQNGVAWVVIADRADEESGLDALLAGAAAIVPRSASVQDIAAATRAVGSGLLVIPRQLVDTLLHSQGTASEKLSGSNAGLTAREREVLAAMADGASNKAIARRLGISFHTVKFHVAAILEKLDADTRTEAVMKAAQQGAIML